MKTLFILFSVLGFFGINECFAQVYVFAREDKADILQNFNVEDGGAKIQKQLTEREGKWFSLLETEAPGHGSIFCVADTEGTNPKYFYSSGKAKPAEAIMEARSKAQDYSKGKTGLNVFVMRTFNNQNKYPLKHTN
jgi:hypothetical protein